MHAHRRNGDMLSWLVMIIVIHSIFETHCQLVITSDQEAKEGDAEMRIPCDYSQLTYTPVAIQWDEINEDEKIIQLGIVNDKKITNGRFELSETLGKADLVISLPTRSDSQRIFQCQIQTSSGTIQRSNPSILTVYYLDKPVIAATASSIYKGQSVTFTCIKPDGDPVPHTIQWFKNGQKVNTKIYPRYEIASKGTVLKIKSATEKDNGRYTCKTESDQFKGDYAKTSVGKQFDVYYIIVTFKPDIGFATCIAEGYSKPTSVLILQDKEVVRKGENTVTIKTNDTMCQSSLTCFAENEKCNNTTTLENCNAGSSCAVGTVITAIVALILGSVPTFLTTRYIFVRRIHEVVSKLQNLQYQALQFPSHSGGNTDLNNKDLKIETVLTRTPVRSSRRPTRMQHREVKETKLQHPQYHNLQVLESSGVDIDEDGYVRPVTNVEKRGNVESQNHQYQGLLTTNDNNNIRAK